MVKQISRKSRQFRKIEEIEGKMHISCEKYPKFAPQQAFNPMYRICRKYIFISKQLGKLVFKTNFAKIATIYKNRGNRGGYANFDGDIPEIRAATSAQPNISHL